MDFRGRLPGVRSGVSCVFSMQFLSSTSRPLAPPCLKGEGKLVMFYFVDTVYTMAPQLTRGPACCTLTRIPLSFFSCSDSAKN